MNDDNSSSTGHTKFDKFQSYKTDEIFKKSAQYKKMLSSISEHNINQAQKYLDRKKQKLMKFFPILFISEPFLSTKNCFNMPAKVFVHFDLDCFFASVETLSNSHYKDIPIAVGSNMMISTANYKARRYGVRSAMPGYKAKAMCSDLVIIKPDIEKYKQYSNVIMRLLGKFDQNISIKSIDEAVLCFDEQKYRNALNVIKNEFRYKLEDILKSNTGVYCVQETPCEAVEENGGRWIYEANNTKNENSEISKNYPKNHDAVNQKKYTVSLIDTFCFANIEILVKIIREIILEKTGLTISAGISVTKLLSKLASSIKKPNEQTTIKINCQEFLNKKPIEKLNGIGKQT
ncbi:DNA polymerase kappa, partial [Dictyocoela roeselum]